MSLTTEKENERTIIQWEKSYSLMYEKLRKERRNGETTSEASNIMKQKKRKAHSS